ncbi:MAG: DUF6089 family protein [Cytophagaceae bacterium]|jgi:hypothetical protein|nr:DUF6089 family protein [Cytophagaceae bacterium]
MKISFAKTIVKSFFTIVFVCLGQWAAAQVHEIGLSAGVSAYSGDIIQHIDWLHPRPSGQLFYRANFTHVFSLKVAAGLGVLASSDESYDNPMNNQRGHSFTTTYNELTVMTEYNFLDYRYNSKDDVYRFSPYFTMGLGLLSFNNGITPPNNAVNTGSGAPVTIPFGVGIKFRTHSNWNFQWQFIATKTFTDALDGLYELPSNVKSYSNPNSLDWYYFTGISAGYVFYKVDCPKR